MESTRLSNKLNTDQFQPMAAKGTGNVSLYVNRSATSLKTTYKEKNLPENANLAISIHMELPSELHGTKTTSCCSTHYARDYGTIAFGIDTSQCTAMFSRLRFTCSYLNSIAGACHHTQTTVMTKDGGPTINSVTSFSENIRSACNHFVLSRAHNIHTHLLSLPCVLESAIQ
eukprot:5525854-Amphidinium_carterae.1